LRYPKPLFHPTPPGAQASHGEIKRLSTTVQDLLEISGFDAGAAALDLEELALDDLVVRTVATYTHDLVPVFVSPRAKPSWVMADRRRLQRVLVNLLGKASAHGRGLSPYLSTALTMRPGSRSRTLGQESSQLSAAARGGHPFDHDRNAGRIANGAGATGIAGAAATTAVVGVIAAVVTEATTTTRVALRGGRH
jgi:hypothetical protein